jgi:hypothetical protein
MCPDDLTGIIKKIIRTLEGCVEIYAMSKNVLPKIEHSAGYVQYNESWKLFFYYLHHCKHVKIRFWKLRL